MNPITLIALGVLAAVTAWIVLRGDWLIRTWRSTALVLLSVVALPLLALYLQPPLLYLAWVAVAALLWIPLFLRFGWVLSMRPPDGPLAARIDKLQSTAAGASRAFRAGRIDGSVLASRVGLVREQAARLAAPDSEWDAFLGSWLRDLELTEAMARNPGSPELSLAEADAVRAEAHARFAELVATRASFWR